jgi:hypothetical protein
MFWYEVIAKNNSVQSSELYYDRRSVGQSVLVSGIRDQCFSFIFRQMWEALSDKKSDL